MGSMCILDVGMTAFGRRVRARSILWFWRFTGRMSSLASQPILLIHPCMSETGQNASDMPGLEPNPLALSAYPQQLA